MSRTPLPLAIVKVAFPVVLLVTLWLKIRDEGLSDVEHGTITGVGEGLTPGDGVGVEVGVGVGLAFPFPLPLLPLSPPLPLPFPCGVAVCVGVGSVGSIGSIGSTEPGVGVAWAGVLTGSGTMSPSPIGVR